MNPQPVPLPIPTLDGLDAAWFTEMFRAGGHLTDEQSVVTTAATRIGEGSGMASLLWRFELTYDAPHGQSVGAPSSVIVKLATDDPHRLFIMQTAKFYAREVRFYNELAADAPVRVPRCWHAAIDPDTSMFVLVLEDVGPLRHVDQLVGCGFDDAVAALRTLARFQARWWGRDLSDLATTFVPMDDPFNQFVVPVLHQQGWPAARDARPDLWPADVSAFLDGFVAKVPAILEGLMGPNTLIHNDYRVDNLLWDGDDIVVLDFQMSSVASAPRLRLLCRSVHPERNPQSTLRRTPRHLPQRTRRERRRTRPRDSVGQVPPRLGVRLHVATWAHGHLRHARSPRSRARPNHARATPLRSGRHRRPLPLPMTSEDTPTGEPTGAEKTPWATLAERYSGEPGIVHGGIQATILDEVMGRAVTRSIPAAERNRPAVTATFELRYRSACRTETVLVAASFPSSGLQSWSRARSATQPVSY